MRWRGVIGIAATAYVVASLAAGAQATQAVAGATQAVDRAATVQTPEVSSRAMLDKYCVTCHSDKLKTGGLSLEKLDMSQVSQNGEICEKIILKLNAGMMPPAGMPRPPAATVASVVSFLATTLDRAALAHPNPGPALIHRVNRAEYANAIRDLLGLDVDVASLLPPDDAVAGFDNIAAALGSSPALLERYLSAAMKIAPMAVGIYRGGPGATIYHAPGDSTQLRHIEGLPFGTRGGMLIEYTFPVDGEYLIAPTLWRNNVGKVRGLEDEHQLEILIDDVEVHHVVVGTREQYLASVSDRNNAAVAPAFDASLKIRVPVKAGKHVVGVTFAQKTEAMDPQKLRPLLSPPNSTDTHGVPQVDMVVITGPFSPGSAVDAEFTKHVFVCRPKSAADEAPCARTILSTLARRAYRRPSTQADVDVLFSFYQASRKEGGSFDEGIERALTRLLTSPDFLFRMEFDAANAVPDSIHRVSDIELASRLSFFLWSSIPDDTLIQLASQGRLHDPNVLDQQVKRMIADPRADAMISNFLGQWLYLRNIRNVAPVFEEFQDFDDDLRQAFKKETEMFFGSIMREDRNVLELLTANYTFVNERLAKAYGIPNVYGSNFRRVPVTDEARRGLLGQGSILSVTSNPNRTSPVKRGKSILDNLLGTPPPPPPPNVPLLVENANRDGKVLTMRERMEEHRANPACASCHKLMDPLGLALENYDAVGTWREKDGGVPIDTKTQLADGTAVDGPAGLRAALVRRPDAFVGTITQKLLIYALGRGLESYDMPTVREIVKNSAGHDYRFSSLILGIVKSTPFQMRSVSASTTVAQR